MRKHQFPPFSLDGQLHGDHFHLFDIKMMMNFHPEKFAPYQISWDEILQMKKVDRL